MDIEINFKKEFTQVIVRTLGIEGIYYFPKNEKKHKK